jgi:murein DD-endopeptidase MepM/ murein hydrolase activator NlpD
VNVRLFLAVVLAAALAGQIPSAQAATKASIDEKIRQQQSKVHNAHLRLKEKRSELGQAQAKVGSLADQLAQTTRNIAAVQARLASINAGIDSTERKLAFNKLQLDAALKTLHRHDEALRRRLIDAYENGELSYVAVLLEAHSFDDFVERWNDIRFVIKANQATIRARKADADRVQGIEVKLLADESSLRDAMQQAGQQKNALDALATQRKNLLEVADAQRRSVQTEVAQEEEISAGAEAALEELVREKQHEEDARRAARRRAAMLAGETLPPEEGAPGTLLWPVSGPITSPFGMRMHPVYGRPIVHQGIDIAANQGTTIAAAAAGRVIVASYQGDCGNMIAIDHHGGLSSMYCHLSQIFVGVGQDVERGQAIGAVGMTGDATGPHLHFQVMQDGHPVDPMGFLH